MFFLEAHRRSITPQNNLNEEQNKTVNSLKITFNDLNVIHHSYHPFSLKAGLME